MTVKTKLVNGTVLPQLKFFFKSVLNANKQDEFVLKSKREKKGDLFTEHYRQFYRGVEVEGGIFILHFKSGKITKANGHYINTAGIDPVPKITPDDAAISYATYLQISNDSLPKYLHGIVIAEIRNISGKDTIYTTSLCYKINLLGSPLANGETAYIDAHTGKVLKTQKNLYNSSATGTFSTLYRGTRSAGTQYYNNVFNSIDSSRNAIINTWDINNSEWDTYAANAIEFTDNNNIWTVQEHSTNDDQMALDIHWALQEIYDYFDGEHKLQSFDDNEHMIDAFVHAEFNNNKDNAAFGWFPNGDQAFFFGDGESVFKPLGALDVVAHEYAHAITHNFTGLAIDGDVESAMNEGLSDIWGVVIENEVAPEKDHWKIGEEVIDVAGDNCLRNIQDPESSSANVQIANTFGDATYNTPNDFYAKSGIMSHWFYLLSEGGDGQNDNFDDYLVYGLGIDMAAKVVFEGQTGHFADVDNYTEARTAMVDAAEDLFGGNSFQVLQVENAWYAVGIGNQITQPTISGSDLVCYSGSTFALNNSPSGSVISWTTSTNLVITSGQNTNTPSIRAARFFTSGAGWIQANFTSNGYTTEGPRKDFWVGKPGSPTTNPTGYPTIDIPLEANLYVGLTKTPGATFSTSPTWWSTGSLEVDNATPSGCTFHAYDTGIGNFYVTTHNACGTSGTAGGTVDVYSGGGGELGPVALSIMPNPATDYIDVEIIDGGLEPENTEYQVKLFNNQNTLVHDSKSHMKKIKIETRHLPKGLYILQVVYNGKKQAKQVLINR